MTPSQSHLLHQLLNDPAFIAWAQGRDPHGAMHWRQWAAASKVHSEALEKASALVRAFHEEVQSVTDEHIEIRISEALRTARDKERARETRTAFGATRLWTLGIAASLIAMLGIGWLMYRAHFAESLRGQISWKAKTESRFKIITHTGPGVRYVQLPDGSSVVLHQHSSIRFPKQFENSRREVVLQGEAFFEVVKNPAQPFFVYANDLVAKVHGTSFSVKAGRADHHVTVAVKTGKVSVFAKSDAHAPGYRREKALAALVLRCNEQATFERSLSRFVLSKIKTPVLLDIPIERQVFTYLETPVSEVFAQLAQDYGVAIHYDANMMAHCSITATLGDEPLENKLKWICTILEAEYEITPEMIRIKGNACK